MLIAMAFLIGVVAGLRTMTALAAAAWAARLGLVDVGDGWLWWLGHWSAPWIATLLAAGELVTDKLPSTPSRKVPVQFGARLVSGAIAGGAIAGPAGAIAGVAGALAGTLGGAAARAALTRAVGGNIPAALIEDVAAVGGAVLILAGLR